MAHNAAPSSTPTGRSPLTPTRTSGTPSHSIRRPAPTQLRQRAAEHSLRRRRRPGEREHRPDRHPELFHSEHDRLLAQIKATVQQNLDAGDISFATDWVLPGVVLPCTPGTAIAANQWNGERLFQAAKFGTETQYQHIIFDEFARYVAPAIHLAGGVNIHIDPAITSEFANVVYRFGHSMLDENINLYVLGADGKPVINPATGQPQMTQEGLIQAFTNPMKFASDPNMTADIVLGTVNQVSNSIDEFVTGSLQNNLLGLPLDLAALNIARGRDTGVAPLNVARAQLFAISGETPAQALYELERLRRRS